ncbi:MAG: GyrI-like domain-containing protein [Corynebacterium sp.]|uniref:GyrI-like domain-containing protein n=1 Tax=Corynebacterium TaxID=1716 RepID=UPI0026499506|nr:GyrI-like domain-containing protein [Corynebacterium sp.]MDN5581857.1 GyrI-like domain-containing protein [Corynebacterium sp.]MDN5719165.1 GyrI-like domain-containing protein [Corynebacterium sp.]MDN6386517.1 GyrI-like domain-containing protein [Corynebacterium sp.]
MPEPELVDLPARHLAVVRDTVAVEELATFYDRSFPPIFTALDAAGVVVSDAPMAVTHGVPGTLPGASVDISVAVPLDAAFPGARDAAVTAETLPATRTVTLLVRGNYDLLAGAFDEVICWARSQGLTPTGTSWEQYLTEPTPDGDPDANETLIGVLVR